MKRKYHINQLNMLLRFHRDNAKLVSNNDINTILLLDWNYDQDWCQIIKKEDILEVFNV